MSQSKKAHPPQASSPRSGEVEVGSQRIRELEDELARARDQSLRVLAEFDNAKKRLQREREESVRYAAEGLIRQLLPTLDSLEQALVAVEKRSNPQAIVTGVQLIHRQLLSLLDRHGVTRIPAVGERFDPNRHEAVGFVEASDGTPEGVILEEIHAGYTMHGKVVRSAMVKVAKKDSPQSTPARPADEKPGRAVDSPQQATQQSQEGS